MPLQLSSMLLQVVSVAEGVPATQLFTTLPLTQLLVPVLPHAPTPQLVAVTTYPSSLVPLQLSSMLLQLVSVAAGVPAVQLFCSTPLTQV